jgi:PPOX class probable F420-dependent enzyme
VATAAEPDERTAQGLFTPNARSFVAAPLRYATIATINPDGSPHQIVIWYTLRGDEIVVNSRRGRRWPSNLRRDGRANLAIYDGEDAVTIECIVDRAYDGDEAQADIAEAARRFYSPAYADQEIARYRTEQRISFVLRPVRVHVHGDPR